MFDLSVSELAVIAFIGLPILLLVGAMLKKMGFSDLAAIGLAVLTLTPLNWLILAYLVFFRWPIHEELELLRSQVGEKSTPAAMRPTVRGGESNPLHVAIRKGYSDVAEALIVQGVDLEATTADGQTPLQLAITCNRDEIAELLRKHGATS